MIVPNAMISDETIINSTIRDPATCEYVEVPVAYDSRSGQGHARCCAEICQAHPRPHRSPHRG